MADELRFAIIGCGKIALRHAAQTKKYGKLVAVCDVVKESADILAKQFSAKSYYGIDDLFVNEKNIDIACICTPNWLHANHSIQSLKAGCHVLCEKPMAISSVDGKKMIEAAEEADKKLFIVKSTRYNSALIAVKEFLTQRDAGVLYSFQLNCFWNRPAAYYNSSWKGKLKTDGGTLFTQFSHYIDALLWLLGDIKSVKGWRKNSAHQSIIEFEDSGTVAVEMENGMIGGLNWSVNTFQKNMEVSLTIIAEKASIRIGGEYMNKIEYQLKDGIPLAVHGKDDANDYRLYQASMSNHDKVYENLVIALRNSPPSLSNAYDGLKTIETIEKIYNSVSLS